MAEKNLYELPDLSTLSDSDYVILTSGGRGHKITVGDLKKQLGGGDYNALENQPVKWLKSEEGNPVVVRTLNNGLYIFSGIFLPFAGSTSTMQFIAKCLVQVLNNVNTTYLMIFYPPNCTIQYCKITDDTYEKASYNLGSFQKTNISDPGNYYAASTVDDVLQEIGASGILPKVTAADNGKTLKVVNGKWAMVSE